MYKHVKTDIYIFGVLSVVKKLDFHIQHVKVYEETVKKKGNFV